MGQEAAQEGVGVERGEPEGIAVGAVLPAEGHLARLHGDQPIVGDGDSLGIAPEAGELLPNQLLSRSSSPTWGLWPSVSHAPPRSAVASR